MKRVLLDLRMVHGRLHGIARYALELARHLPALAPDLEIVALTAPDGLPAGLGPLRPDVRCIPCAAEFLSAFEQPLLAAALATSRCELFHATSFALPALWPGKLVATIHDANHLAMPELYGAGRVTYYRLVVGPRAKWAKALITDSEFSRGELARHLSIDPHRFQVIGCGVDERYAPQTQRELDAFRTARALPARYFLAVGSTKPHKNLAMLASIAHDLPAPIALLAGEGARKTLGFPDNTIELPDLPEAELPKLYAGAIALLLPSRYEGFGLPALEAMACGCPVLASNAGALPEVIGDAGLMLDPDDRAAWREAALRIAREDPLRASLIELGRERAGRASWADCARRTLEVYRRVLER